MKTYLCLKWRNPMSNPTPSPAKDIDAHEELVARFLLCRDNAQYWTKEKALVQKALEDLLGESEVAKIGGREVLTYARINGFNEGKFKKEHPDLHRFYTHKVEVEEFDREGFERTRPEIYAQYQTRQMKVVQ
jgi:hypothetical protein